MKYAYQTQNEELYACALSYKSTKDDFKIAIGTQGESKQQKIKIISTQNEQLREVASIDHDFTPLQIRYLYTTYELFDYLITTSDSLRLYRLSLETNILVKEKSLYPQSQLYCGPPTCFDIHSVETHSMGMNYLKQPLQVSGSIDSTICAWDLEKQKCVYQAVAHENYVRSVSYSKESNKFATLGGDKIVGIVDLRFPKIHKMINHNTFIDYQYLSWSNHNDSFIAITEREAGFIDVFDLRKTSIKYDRIRAHKGYVSKAAFLEKDILASAGEDGQIFIYDNLLFRPDFRFDTENQVYDFYSLHNLFCYTGQSGVQLIQI